MLEKYRIRKRTLNSKQIFAFTGGESGQQLEYSIVLNGSQDVYEDWANKPKSIKVTRESTLIIFEKPDSHGDTTLLMNHTPEDKEEFDIFEEGIKATKKSEPCPLSIEMLEAAGIDYTSNANGTYEIYNEETGTNSIIDPNNLVVYSQSYGEDSCINSTVKFYEQICGKCYVKEQIDTKTEILPSGYPVKRITRTNHDNIYISDCNEDCFVETPYGKLYEIPCDLSIIPLSDCQLTYDFGFCDQFLTVMWKDPNGVLYNSKIVDVTTNGTWYAFVKDLDSCFQIIDSIEINSCPPFEGSLCSNINTDATGNGDWNSTYISDGDGTLHLVFYTATVPDQLIVSKNGVEVANSGYYSSVLCGTDYHDCIGTVVPGCGTDYNFEMPVSTGDNIELTVIGNNCNANNTVWNLQAYCYDESNQGGGDLNFRGIRENDDLGLESISIYPNPFKNILMVEVPQKYTGYSIEINNLNGETVYENAEGVQNNKLLIDTKLIPKGIYFVKITTDEGKIIRKFIKN